MKSRTYWLIFIAVSTLIAVVLLAMGGVFDFGNKSDNVAGNNNIGVAEKTTKTVKTNKSTNKNEEEKVKEVDILQSDVDFESDPEDFSDDTDDVKSFDDNSDFDSIDSEIY